MATQPDLNRIRTLFQRLDLAQAKELYGELGAIITSLEQTNSLSENLSRKVREVVEVQHEGDRLYQRELIRCGKLHCRCAGDSSELHGPYWYVYWREEGRLKSRYVGKKLKTED